MSEELRGKETDLMNEQFLRVDPGELYQFHWDHTRNIWNPTGQRCHVPGCPYRTLYTKIGDFLDHWVDVHKREFRLFKCKFCGEGKRTRNKMKHHIKDQHPGKDRTSFTEKVKNNYKYIDPGDLVPPRPGTPEERRQAMEAAKQKAIEERHRQVKHLKRSTPIGSSSIVCRDEDVTQTLHPDEPAKKRVKTSWMPKGFKGEEEAEVPTDSCQPNWDDILGL